jgi:proline iminopeptidase
MSVRRFLILAAIAPALGTILSADAAIAQQNQPDAAPTETRLRVPGASLYVRTIGRGPSVLVLHGGPDFDISYLLPEMDALSDGYRLIYYDQRARGKSADKVRAEDVTLATEIADLNAVRQRFGVGPVVVLGHSWGAVLALEYALRHPTSISRLILLNPAPASASDRQLLVTSYLRQLGPDMDRQNQIRNGRAYKEGDPDAVTARYRIHFEHAFARPAD